MSLMVQAGQMNSRSLTAQDARRSSRIQAAAGRHSEHFRDAGGACYGNVLTRRQHGLRCNYVRIERAGFPLKSTVELTAAISRKPICVTGSNSPGYTCSPLPSITLAPVGTSTAAPTLAILPFWMTTVPSSMAAPDRVKIFA